MWHADQKFYTLFIIWTHHNYFQFPVHSERFYNAGGLFHWQFLVPLIIYTDLPTLKISEWDSRNCPTKIGPFEWEMLEIFALFSPVSYMSSLSQKLPHLQSHAIAPLWGWQACIYNHLHSQWFAQGNMSSHMQGIYTTLRIGEEGSEAGIYIQQQYNLENTILFISSSHARIHVTKQQ